MKTKKLAIQIAALMLACAMMASCASKPADDKNASSAPPSIVKGDDGREKVDGVMYKEGLPIVDPGTYSFSIFLDDNGEDNDFVIMKMLEEQTGIKVDLQIFPNTVAKEKLSLALATGNYPDSIGGWLLADYDILTQGVNEGVYVPLDSYFADYCPKITEILEIEGVRDAMTTPDGHIYSIPYVLEAPEAAFMPFINMKWLKKVGMDMPQTTGEFKEVLKAFKAQDANENGDPNDEIPFVLDTTNSHIGKVCGWFGMSVDDIGFTMVGDQLTYGANTEEYKNGIKFLAELYAEDLMDKEMFTQDKSQWKAKGENNKFGVAGMYGSGDAMPYDAGVVPDWEALPVLKSPNVDKPVYLRSTYGTDVLRTQVVITDNAKNPEVICRWWDNFFDLENVLQSQNGPLDVTLFKMDDGGYRRIELATMSESDQKLYNWWNLFPQTLPKYIPDGFRVFEDPATYPEKDVADKVYEPYLTEMMPPYWVDGDKATRLSDLTTTIQTYIKQTRAEWISGQSDIDKDWDGYLKQLEKLNLQELIDIRVEAIK